MSIKAPISGRWLVTGASSGIGLAVSEKLLARGVEVIGTGSRALSDVEVPPGRFRYVSTDFRCPRDAVAEIQAFLEDHQIDRLDGVIQNAGLGRVGPPETESPDEFGNITNVNLVTPVLLARALFAFLEKTKGTMVFTGSVVVGKSAPDYASYAATKEALTGFSRSLRLEWQGRVRVLVLHPGPTRTGMHARAGFDPGLLRNVMADPGTAADALIEGIEHDRDGARVNFFGRLSGGGFRAAQA